MVTVVYTPPKGEMWEKTVEEKVAEKMVKMGRWKYKKEASPQGGSTKK